jgi:hypothetical protein
MQVTRHDKETDMAGECRLNFPRILVGGAAFALLLAAAAERKSRARPKTPPLGIEIEGYPSQINVRAGTFTIADPTDIDTTSGLRATPPFHVVTTAKTTFEPREGPDVSRKTFFQTLGNSDTVEVKGYLDLDGRTVSAYRVEIED